MLASQIPTKFQIPFGKNAAAGTIRTVPVADQTATSPGAASLTTGFPVATGQPLAAGGIPPAMQDFNGLFNQITAWSLWQAAAGLVPYDSTFSSQIGGYPAGASVLSNTTPGRIWISTADNNTTNPDGGSASNWLALMLASDVQALLGTLKIPGSVLNRYVTPGTYTLNISAGAAFEAEEVRGAGGGGGGANSTAASASGGGGGGRARGFYQALTATVLTVTVGAGGSAGSGGSGPTNGGAGGTSSIVVTSGSVINQSGVTFTAGQTLCAATGGGGGYAAAGTVQNTQFGAAGTASGGDINDSGDQGGYGYGTSGAYIGGNGGASPGSGGPAGPNYATGGFTSTAPGTGGTGSAANAPGGAGSPGRVTIRHA